MDNNNIKNKDLKTPYKFELRCIIEDSSTRMFRLITEYKHIEQIITNTKLPYVFFRNK